jgi:3-isopropylmalate/(R)-2-methylmalate dehydratase small subunit
VLIAPSYADIFFNNCFKNGVLPIVLSEDDVDALFKLVEGQSGFELVVDLAKQTVRSADGQFERSFEVEPFRKHCLLNGLDDIGLTLQKADKIKAYEAKRLQDRPWVAADPHQRLANA